MGKFYLSVRLQNDSLIKVVRELYILSNELLMVSATVTTHSTQIIDSLTIVDGSVSNIELNRNFLLSKVGNNAYALHFIFENGTPFKIIDKLVSFLIERAYLKITITTLINGLIDGIQLDSGDINSLTWY